MARRRKLPALRDLLAYRNAEVVNRFLGAWTVSKPEATRLFDDMLRFLWASAQHPELVPVPIVDEMWHTFLVYTRPYREFSERYFGKMRDHEPRTMAEIRARRRQLQRSPEQARQRLERELEHDVSIVYDCLGKQVVKRWYSEYPERFGPRFFASGRRTAAVDTATMIAASEAFFAAIDRGDVAELRESTSTGFVMLSNDRIHDAASWIASLGVRSSGRAARTWHHTRCFATGASVVFVGRATEHLEGVSGSLDRTGWHTLVWARDGGAWKVAHYQWQRADVDAERRYWNEVYQLGIDFDPEPNHTLVEAIARRPPGAALDLMMGQGRNAIYLAEHGWKVTGVDVSDVGIRIAKAAAAERALPIEAIQADVNAWDLGTDAWDLVTLVYAPGSVELVERVKRSLKKGGLFVTEYFHDAGELAPLFAGDFEILRANVVEEVADFGGAKRKLERLVVEKR